MKRIIGILCGLFFFLFSFAQETFQQETYISSRGDTLLYRLLRPEVMQPDEKYPLVLFLHGAGAVSYTHLDVYKRQQCSHCFGVLGCCR